MRRAFTLIEMLVVLAVVTLATALAVPATRTLIREQQEAGARQTFETLLGNAQAQARQHFSPIALRVERAFEVDSDGQLVLNQTGFPVWKNHQQVRMLGLSMAPSSSTAGTLPAFRPIEARPVKALPELVWLAPSHVLDASYAQTIYAPAQAGAAMIDTFDTFYLAFNRRGELVRLTASELLYADATQNDLVITHPEGSARGAILYDRAAFTNSGRDLEHLRRGTPLMVNRYLGLLTPTEE